MTIASKLLLLGDTETAGTSPVLEAALGSSGVSLVDVHAFEVGSVERADRVTDVTEVRTALISAARAEGVAIYCPWPQDLDCPDKLLQLCFVATLLGVEVYVGRPPVIWRDAFSGVAARGFCTTMVDLARAGQDVLASAGGELLAGELATFLRPGPAIAGRTGREGTAAGAGPAPEGDVRVHRAVVAMKRAGMTDRSVANVLNTLGIRAPQGRDWTRRVVDDYRHRGRGSRRRTPPNSTP